MVLARLLDRRQQQLCRDLSLPVPPSCHGREAAQSGSAAALQAGQDLVALTASDLAAVLTLGVSPWDVLLEALGRAAGPWSGGRQAPGHYGDRSRRILSSGGLAGAQISRAAGAAFASRLRGERAVTLCYFGAGASRGGDFHEALNFAALQRLPVVYLCQNDSWAGAPARASQSLDDAVARRAAAYGIPGQRVDGSDLFAVHRATCEALSRARAGGGPSLIEVQVVSLPPAERNGSEAGGSLSDVERAALLSRDPLPRYQAALRADGLLSTGLQAEIKARVGAQVDQAAAFALDASPPFRADATRPLLQAAGLGGSLPP
jgi:2-oxoisovalerate dehydrogenase E1 component alpha subunit